MEMYWPIGLIILSNIVYHISSKQTPEGIDPLASVTITYLVGAATSLVLYFILNKNPSLEREYMSLSWSSFLLGVAIVGLEVGTIYMYRVGWNVNTGHLFHSTIFTVALLLMGKFLYDESLTATKLIGVIVCMVGAWLIKQ